MQMNCKNNDFTCFFFFFLFIHNSPSGEGGKEMKKRGNQTFGLTGALCPLNRAEDDGTARSKLVLNALRERDLGCGELQMFFGLRRGGEERRGEERSQSTDCI